MASGASGSRRSSAPDLLTMADPSISSALPVKTKKMGKSPVAGGRLPESVYLKHEIENAIYDFRRHPGREGSMGSGGSGSSVSLFATSTHSDSPVPPTRRTNQRSMSGSFRFPRGASYLHTNFRFVTRDEVSADPDEPLEWSSIDLVLVPAASTPVCPICLDEPKLPKLTRCGHTFCHLCLLRFAALGLESTKSSVASSLGFGASWRRCPICFEDFSLKELKSTRFVPQTDLCETGGWLEFTLRKMPQTRIRVADKFEDLSPLDRITRITEDFFQTEVIERDEKELFKVIAESEQFDADLLKLEQTRTPPYQDKKSPLVKKIDRPHPSTVVYFHQASDGQALFLHPLCIRMMKEHFGAYNEFPSELTLRVVEVEWLTMDYDARRRFRQLAHLPIGSQFGLCEVDLEPILPATIIASHSKELQSRSRAREQRAKSDDERRDLFYRQESHKMLEEINGYYPGTPLSEPLMSLTDDLINFPPVSSEFETGSIPIPISGTGQVPSVSLASSFANIAAGTSPVLFLEGDRKKRLKNKIVLLGGSSHRSFR